MALVQGGGGGNLILGAVRAVLDRATQQVDLQAMARRIQGAYRNYRANQRFQGRMNYQPRWPSVSSRSHGRVTPTPRIGRSSSTEPGRAPRRGYSGGRRFGFLKNRYHSGYVRRKRRYRRRRG